MTAVTRSRVWIALGGPSVNLGVAVMLGLEPSLPLMSAQLLSCYAVYILNTVSDLGEDAVSNPSRAAFAQRHARLIVLGAAGCVVLATALALPFGLVPVLGIFLPFLAGLAYSFKASLPSRAGAREGGRGPRRLKDILLVKNLTIAATWSMSALALQPDLEGVPATALLASGVLVALRFLVTSILPDWRDIEADRAHGVRTVPVVFGPAMAMRLVRAINLLFVIGVMLFAGLGILAPPTWALLAIAAYAVLYLEAIARAGRATPLLCDLVMDGEHVLFGLVLLAGRIG